jgi:hypothetical protein
MSDGFRAALEEQLSAIRARDIDRFRATVSSSDEARVIGPTGDAIVGGEAIVGAHREWFASASNWEFRPTIVWTRETREMAFALLRVEYDEAQRAGSRFLLSLLFVQEAGVWRMIYDQNTGIPDEG